MGKINSKNTSKELFKNTGIIGIGQMSTKLVSFLLLPLYTALLTTEEYGTVDLLTTYSTVLMIIVGLQMNLAIFRYLVTNRDNEGKIRQVCSSVAFASIITFSVYAVTFYVIQPYLTIAYSWYLLFHVGAALFLNIVCNISRGLGRNADYAFGNFLSSTITIVLNILFIAVLRLDLKYMLIAYITGPITGGSIVFIKCKMWKNFSIKCIHIREIKQILQYSLPLVPNELSWSVIHASDRMIVSWVLSVAVNGLIAVAVKISSIYTTVFYVFNASWTEQVVLHYKDEGGKEYINEMFDKMVSFFACFAIGIIAVLPFAFSLLVGPEFADAYGLLPLYLLAVFFNAVIGLISPIYLVNNETKKVASSTMVAAFINVLVDLLLIKVIGMYAAPVASICGYMTISFWRLWDVNKRHCRIWMAKKKIVSLVILFVVATASFYSKQWILQVLVFIIIVIMILKINFSILKQLAEMFIRRKK
ncbi:lipopolysaccharide biosynthesis protein [Blautia hydrogenotrophica]|uniref:Uncharacterized protein n=1 Tax=Blautia hydrogenotrophica (strain DSM 10507 / JCM 14656 / S5a33) TaxID=476272 RepID=C0CGX6_BLAHS|nr:oligosaccharide flippase family protein [Blautia hydrogenotrophica]EEG51032.1 polysaccharide biosynthesis protein [Blautia hydrogenotrophica DSM 10507]MCT6797003.1 oligosaccharide flippase family protein [Blautia hydrogenotrophica]WPX83212.1 hypothetical protein BLHYD_12100 [Blautia hydrogenotrophica DSM 10507]